MKKLWINGIAFIIIMTIGFTGGFIWAETLSYEPPTEYEMMDWYLKHDDERVAHTILVGVTTDENGEEWYKYRTFDEGGDELTYGGVIKEYCDCIYNRYHENG